MLTLQYKVISMSKASVRQKSVMSKLISTLIVENRVKKKYSLKI